MSSSTAMGEEEHEQPPQGDCQQKEPTPPLPKAPQPETDTAILPAVTSPNPHAADDVDPDEFDIFSITPVQALKLLCTFVETLVRMTGDVPPTPPTRSRGHSPNSSLSGLRNITNADQVTGAGGFGGFGGSAPASVDGVTFVKTPIGSPEAHPQEPLSVIGAHAEPVHVQHGIIARKFWSKRPPGIPLLEYLMRMHKYCAMSTAVYLATAHYIARLAVRDRLLPVTPRNVHRLVLAGLRVSMKALEDMCWPHSRFAKVGGVTESELGRLEVTFLFLMSFELKVDAAILTRETESLARAARGSSDTALLTGPTGSTMELKLPARGGEKRKASSTLPSRPAIQVNNGTAIEVMGQS